jgi:hypothetical protein
MKCTKFGSVISVAFFASSYSVDAQAQARGCATPFILCAGCDAVTAITVQAGKVCVIRAFSEHTRRDIAVYGTAVLSQKVVVRPHGGIYGTANQTLGAYKPNLGFVGSDSFQVDIEVERTGQRFVSHLKATVNVLP